MIMPRILTRKWLELCHDLLLTVNFISYTSLITFRKIYAVGYLIVYEY